MIHTTYSATADQPSAAGARSAPPSAALDVSELVALAGALNTLSSVAAAISCQPRMSDRDGRLSAAGREFEDVMSDISDRIMDVMVRLHEAKATDVANREKRGAALLAYELGQDDDVSAVAINAVTKAFPSKF